MNHNMLEETVKILCKDVEIEGQFKNHSLHACDNSNTGTAEGNSRKICNEA